MDDEELWTPPPRVRSPSQSMNADDDDGGDIELFDARKWRPSPNDPSDFHLATASYPLFRPKQWSCKYGCPGLEYPDGRQFHVWNCLHWDNEGKHDTPFG